MAGPGAIPWMMRAAALSAPHVNRAMNHPATKRAINKASKHADKAARTTARYGRTLIGNLFTRGSMAAGSTHPPGTGEALKMIAINEMWGSGAAGQALMRGNRVPLEVFPPGSGTPPKRTTAIYHKTLMTGKYE